MFQLVKHEVPYKAEKNNMFVLMCARTVLICKKTHTYLYIKLFIIYYSIYLYICAYGDIWRCRYGYVCYMLTLSRQYETGIKRVLANSQTVKKF